MSNFERPRHILRANQFNLPFIHHLFHLTDNIRKLNKSKEGLLYLSSLLNHRRVMLYFTQPSTRTFLSFQSACHILGTRTSEIRDASVSSEKKGESIEDSLRTFSSYVDLIVMRSPVMGLCDRIASLLDETQRPIPIINAGSGPDEHPTQALLDLYTLYRSFKDINGINNKTICMVGDLKRGRTVRSLSKLLSFYENVHIIYCSPKPFQIADDLRSFLLKSQSITFEETENFRDSIRQADSIYMTRVQDEYDDGTLKDISTRDYHLTWDHMETLKPECFILHPFPRRHELDPRIDFDSRAKYWRQERNGMWIRVALMAMIFDVDDRVLAVR